jgi:ATP-dependent Lhr-like helicase
MRWARHLLDSYGLVSKPLVAVLSPFPWERLLPVFKQLELLGHVARGLFVKEIESVQFARPDLLTQLAQTGPANPSANRIGSSEEPFTLLSAADPGNAYGWLLPWPSPTGGAGFARKPGNWLVWRGSRWSLWLENGGRRIAEPARAQAGAPPHEAELKAVLRQCLRRQGLRKIVVDSWNGKPVAETEEGAVLQRLGAERDRTSFVLWPSQLG